MNDRFKKSLKVQKFSRNYNQIFVFTSLLELGFGVRDFLNLVTIFEELSQEEFRLVFPSYTYSSRRGEVFDPLLTPPDPQNGAMSRMLFERSSFISRTLDPDFSYLIIGNEKQALPTDEYEFSRSFGENSHHAELLKIRSAVLLIGPVLETGLTLAMHLESKFGVPWRKDIKTQYFCARKKKLIKHSYFAKVENFPTDKLPCRRNLYPLIKNLETTVESEPEEVPWVLFDWEDFASAFFHNLVQNVYFQTSARL